MNDKFLIEKRGLYYRPHSAGYTGVKTQAGRYSFDEAAVHAGPNGPDGSRDGITIWRESEAPEYSPACSSEARFQSEVAKERARAEAAEDALARFLLLVREKAMQATSAEHNAEERAVLLDHETLMFQRDCEITAARAALNGEAT